MRPALISALLALAFAAATAALGWWAVPVLGAIWGAVRPVEDRPVRVSASAAAAAWAVLLGLTALKGPVGPLAGKLAGVIGAPGLLSILATLIFPAVLAGSAAGLAAAIRGAVGRSGGVSEGA